MRRRTLLTTAPLLGLGAALPPVMARAAAHAPAPLPAAQRFGVGEETVTALLDGALRIEPAMLSVEPDAYAELMREAFRDPETYRSAINGFAIERPDGLILVDAGSGAAMGPIAGHLPSNLEAAGQPSRT